MENYHVLELIGEGSFGKVYKGRKRFSGQVVALKFIPKVGRSEKDLKNLRREIEIMRNLHHGNIIEMLDSFETDKEVVAVTDYAEGELFQILEDDGQLPEEQVQSIAAQLVSALFYLHSHRILHRDMKPQNILLGKGGIVKLCDFGFARAMSINTLVLTSIKGTPLYMSPELVEEKPYDHTADLWALGCILYELYTGQPPFYTNSIFQLVSLIIKDPVRWPKDMSSVFKEFLQGLLTKNPRHRLSWPQLLEHPFVKDSVTVSDEDKTLPSPFTSAPTASLIFEKEKQSKARAHPPGTSKILSKAREKAEKESKKKQPQAPAPRIEAWGGKPPGDGQQEPMPIHPERPLTAEWDEPKQGNKSQGQLVEPTPRPDRLTRDYEQEYPDVEVESRKVIRREPERKKKKGLENVKLKEEDADSDDEWQALVEATDPEAVNPDNALRLIKERSFTTKLRGRLQSSSVQVLDAVLEGASRLRPVLKIIMNLVTTKSDLTVLLPFIKGIDCPKHILTVLDQMLSKQTVKEQAWCQKILVDLVATCHAYFASDVLQSANEDKDSLQSYLDSTLKFLELAPKLLHQKLDKDLILREQTLMCVIFLCEAMERSDTSIPQKFFEGISNQRPALQGILTCAMLEESVLKRLEEVTEGNAEEAQQRMEDMICLGVAALSALMTIPVHPVSGCDGKKQIGFAFGALLCEKENERYMLDYLLLLNHPSTCYNILKVIYTVCQHSKVFAAALAASKRDIGTILGILQGKVQLVDMECNSVLEIVLYLLSVIIIQNEDIPPDVAANTPFLITVFIESQLASHTAAAALLFTQLLTHGAAGEVQPEDLLNAALSEFTDLAQICIHTPFNYGVLDGLSMLLSLLLTQGELPIAGLYVESGIWSILWHRVAQMMQVRESEANIPVHDIEAGDITLHSTIKGEFPQPDWNLMSFQGLMASLNIAISVFTKETYKVLANLTSKESVLLLSLSHMLNRNFLEMIKSSEQSEDGYQPVQEMILLVTQICCFPFAVDTDEETLADIQICFAQTGLLPKLFEASVCFLGPELLELPMGLISRLVLGEPSFIQQFAETVNRLKAVPFLTNTVKMTPESSVSVMCDTISICSHLVRTTPEYVNFLIEIFKGPKGDFTPLDLVLSNPNPVVRSRTCSMIGNMMKHSSGFYKTLKLRPQVLMSLTLCLKDEDPNVRKGASYAIGNATFHSGELYEQLKPCISELLSVLDDPVAKTRANAAGALGNFALHSSALCNNLIKEKAVHSVLELACNDSQYGVQECALTALRTMANQTALRKELKRLNAIDKLSNVTNGDTKVTPRTRRSMALSKSSGRHSVTTVMSHCSKLIRVLSNESQA